MRELITISGGGNTGKTTIIVHAYHALVEQHGAEGQCFRWATSSIAVT